jgi:hypothetical protein
LMDEKSWINICWLCVGGGDRGEECWEASEDGGEIREREGKTH